MTRKFDGDPQLGDLRALLALVEAGTVTAASEVLGLSQSALSYQLDRMRRQWGDPLFVRTGNRMTPTPRVERMLEPVTQVLHVIDTEIKGESSFDPQTSEREFKVSVNEIGAITFVPKLLRELAQAAPKTRLSQQLLDPSTLSADLERAHLDLASGYVNAVDNHLVSRLLYRRDYVCIASTHHPRVRASIGWAQLGAERILLNPGMTRVNQWVERQLAENGQGMASPMLSNHVAALPFTVASSDLVSFVPREVFHLFKPIADIKIVRTPLKPPAAEIYQYWHPRMNADPAHKFFRDLVYAVGRASAEPVRSGPE